VDLPTGRSWEWRPTVGAPVGWVGTGGAIGGGSEGCVPRPGLRRSMRVLALKPLLASGTSRGWGVVAG